MCFSCLNLAEDMEEKKALVGIINPDYVGYDVLARLTMSALK